MENLAILVRMVILLLPVRPAIYGASIITIEFLIVSMLVHRPLRSRTQSTQRQNP